MQLKNLLAVIVHSSETLDVSKQHGAIKTKTVEHIKLPFMALTVCELLNLYFEQKRLKISKGNQKS